MKSVFVIWKDIADGMWHTVAKLSRSDNVYTLNYTRGAEHPNFIAFPRMSDKTASYVSNELFAFFKNRLLPMNRPEFKKMLEWSDLSMNSYDELDMLSISGGARKTDQYRIISKPQVTSNNEYKIRFFISGISHLKESSIQKIADLEPGDSLNFECEDDNQFDCDAVLVTTVDEKKIKVGYCPKYYNADIRTLLNSSDLAKSSIKVVKTNPDSPAHFKLLCEFSADWPKNFTPLNSNDYLAYEEGVECC